MYSVAGADLAGVHGAAPLVVSLADLQTARADFWAVHLPVQADQDCGDRIDVLVLHWMLAAGSSDATQNQHAFPNNANRHHAVSSAEPWVCSHLKKIASGLAA